MTDPDSAPPVTAPAERAPRIRALDGLRGVAAFFVVISHTTVASSTALSSQFYGDPQPLTGASWMLGETPRRHDLHPARVPARRQGHQVLHEAAAGLDLHGSGEDHVQAGDQDAVVQDREPAGQLRCACGSAATRSSRRREPRRRPSAPASSASATGPHPCRSNEPRRPPGSLLACPK